MQTLEQLTDNVITELERALKAVSQEDLDTFRTHILQANRIFTAGKGRSGLQMRGFAMRLMHLSLTVHAVDDVTTPAITEGDLLLISSGSGRTTSIVQYAQKAGDAGAKVALVTIDPESPAAKLSDCVVQIPASSPKLTVPSDEQSILPMGSLFEQAMGILFELVIVQLMNDLNVDAVTMFTRHANLE